MNLRTFSVIGFLLLVIVIMYLMTIGALLAQGPVLVALQIAAVVLMIWARITFGTRSFHAGANPTKGGLVTTGPYKFIRHPIYAAVLLFVLAGIAAHLSFLAALAGVAAVAAVYIRIRCEEQLIVQQYPEYTAYARRTKRLIPFLL